MLPLPVLESSSGPEVIELAFFPTVAVLTANLAERSDTSGWQVIGGSGIPAVQPSTDVAPNFDNLEHAMDLLNRIEAVSLATCAAASQNLMRSICPWSSNFTFIDLGTNFRSPQDVRRN